MGNTDRDSSVEMASISHSSCSAVSCEVSSSASRSATRMLCNTARCMHQHPHACRAIQGCRTPSKIGNLVLHTTASTTKQHPCGMQLARHACPQHADLEARRAQAASSHAIIKPGTANLAQQALQRPACRN